ncbi:BMC domain-containing protein [Almyronema epifaneia]|uniref:BMC domain-containing protein n=1 Tax=Almyronema epifaneia S1 TaxID=2991925 RepID=A0ABW6IFR6_9CYAN
MLITLGMIEVFGLSTAIKVADSMCKSGQVQLVQFANAEAGLISVVVQGRIADVQAAVAAGLATAQQANAIASHRVITSTQPNHLPRSPETMPLYPNSPNPPADAPETYLD